MHGDREKCLCLHVELLKEIRERIETMIHVDGIPLKGYELAKLSDAAMKLDSLVKSYEHDVENNVPDEYDYSRLTAEELDTMLRLMAKAQRA